MVIWIQILAALLLLSFLIIYEWKWKDKIRSKLLQISITIAASVVVAPLVFNLLSSWVNHEQLKNEENFRKAVLRSILSNASDTSTIKEIIQLRYKEIFDSTEAQAEDWAKNFLSSLESKKKQANTLKKDTQDFGQRLIQKWQPFYEFTFIDFDSKIKKLSQHVQITTAKEDPPTLLNINSAERYRKIVRTVSFPSGSKLLVEVDSGVLDRGKLVRYPSIIFREQREGNLDIIFYLSFYEDHIKVEPNIRHWESIKRDRFQGDLLSTENQTKLRKYISYSIEWLFI